MWKVWEITEQNMRENWKKRIYLFDVPIECVIMYGAEIWDRAKCKELEGSSLKVYEMDSKA